MARHIEITIQGVVGTTPTLRFSSGGERAFCYFRVASTPSYFHEGKWHDSQTMWFTAKAWGTAAEYLARSVNKGDPVVLCGRLSEESWLREGETTPGKTNVLTVTAGGPDATRGMCIFKRLAHPDRAREEAQPSSDQAQGATSCAEVVQDESDSLARDHWEREISSSQEEPSAQDLTESAIDPATGEIIQDIDDELPPQDVTVEYEVVEVTGAR